MDDDGGSMRRVRCVFTGIETFNTRLIRHAKGPWSQRVRFCETFWRSVDQLNAARESSTAILDPNIGLGRLETRWY